jgi:hypothetical protein
LTTRRLISLKVAPRKTQIGGLTAEEVAEVLKITRAPSSASGAKQGHAESGDHHGCDL